jgi:hypothetical protein
MLQMFASAPGGPVAAVIGPTVDIQSLHHLSFPRKKKGFYPPLPGLKMKAY